MPDLSDEGRVMWNKYLSINKGSTNIGYSEINAYCERMGEELTPWETELMIDLDIMRRSDG